MFAVFWLHGFVRVSCKVTRPGDDQHQLRVVIPLQSGRLLAPTMTLDVALDGTNWEDVFASTRGNASNDAGEPPNVPALEGAWPATRAHVNQGVVRLYLLFRRRATTRKAAEHFQYGSSANR